MYEDLKDKVVLITGSSAGIGAAAAKSFAAHSAKLVITGRNSERIDKVAEECKSLSPQNYYPLKVIANLLVEDDIKKLVSETMKIYGRLDVLVNNANKVDEARICDDNFMQAYEHAMMILPKANILLCRSALPYLVKTKGSIINITGISTILLEPLYLSTSLAEAVVEKLTKGLAIEYGPKGVRVNAISPGAVSTSLQENLQIFESEEATNAFLKRTPLRKIGVTSDITNQILYLASRVSNFVTGQVLIIDGGTSLYTGQTQYE